MNPVLLIQLFAEAPRQVSSLEMTMSNHFGTGFLGLDNFSDPFMVSYARQFMEENEKMTTIIWEHKGGILKGVQPLLHALLKRKGGIRLLSNSDHLPIRKLLQIHQGEYVDLEADLWALITKG